MRTALKNIVNNADKLVVLHNENYDLITQAIESLMDEFEHTRMTGESYDRLIEPLAKIKSNLTSKI